MGFFDEIQAKLKALEEAALEAQAEQQRQRAAAQRKPSQDKEMSRRGSPMMGSDDPHRGRVTDPIDGGGASRPRRENAPPISVEATVSQQQTSIFDNLGGRLDEAFLLKEILGEPRCVRGWDD